VTIGWRELLINVEGKSDIMGVIEATKEGQEGRLTRDVREGIRKWLLRSQISTSARDKDAHRASTTLADAVKVTGPKGRNVIKSTSPDGSPHRAITKDGVTVAKESELGGQVPRNMGAQMVRKLLPGQ